MAESKYTVESRFAQRHSHKQASSQGVIPQMIREQDFQSLHIGPKSVL